MGQVSEEAELPQLSRPPLDVRVACSGVGVLRYLAHLIGQISRFLRGESRFSVKGEMREEADAFLTQTLWGFEYNKLPLFFHSEWRYTTSLAILIPKLMRCSLNLTKRVGDLATARRSIGREVLSLLQEDFAMIPLAPCLQYTYSPLEIQFDDKLTCVTDLAQNMSQLVVERH